MRSERLEGYWWRAADPEDKVAGALQLEPADPPVLRLWGTVAGGEAFSQAPPGTIHGLTLDGRHVTLLDTVRTAWRIPSGGYATETLTAGVAVIGRHVESLDAMRVSRLEVGFSTLPEWIGGGSVTDDVVAPDGYRMDVVMPEFPVARHAEAAIAIKGRWSTTGDRIHSRGVVLDYVIAIALEQDSALFDAWSAWVGPVRDFLTLAVDRPAVVTSLRVRTADDKEPLADEGLVDIVGAMEPAPPGAATQRGPVFPLPWLTIRDRFTDVFVAWIRLRQETGDALTLFFAQRYREPYVEPEFVTLAQALEALDRRVNPNEPPSAGKLQAKVDRILAAVPPKDHAWLQGKLRHAQEPTLRERFERLFREADPMVYPEEPAWQVAAKLAADTRHYYTHYDPAMKDRAVHGLQLSLLNRQLAAYMTALILLRLPLTEQEIRQAIVRTTAFRFLLAGERAAALQRAERQHKR